MRKRQPKRWICVDQVKLAIGKYLREYEKFKGREVLITMGRYKGRVAIIKGILVDNNDGLRFCCYVLQKNGEILNTDAESRWYRPVSHFELLPEHEL